MTYCPNPTCNQPFNPNNAKFCSNCGTKLLLGDRYRAVHLLGQGGFGRTFLGVDEYKPGQPPCAIKQFIPPDLNRSQQDKALTLFAQEAERLQQLGQHSQIPELLAYFRQELWQFLVLEYISGSTLAEELEQKGTFSVQRVEQLLANLLPVLEFVHQHQVIHRDIKPENIIYRSGDKQFVLVDFGAAKFATETLLHKTGTVISTAGYTAPEQLLGKAVFASDLYSLGVTCIHLLTGTPPVDLFDSSEDTWFWRKYLTTPVNRSLAGILDRLLERATRRRYATAKAVLEDLQVHPCDRRGKPSQTSSSSASTSPQPAAHWACVRTLQGHSSSIAALALTTDQTLITTGAEGTIKLWDLSTCKLTGVLGEHAGAIQTIALLSGQANASPHQGQILICGGESGQLSFWQLETGELLSHLAAHHRSLKTLAVGGNWLATVGKEEPAQTFKERSTLGIHRIKLWDPFTQELRITLAAETAVYALALSPDGHYLASGGYDGMVRVWEVETGTLLQRMYWQLGPVQAIAISPDGQFLAAGGFDGTIKIWQMEQRRITTWKVLAKHQRSVLSLCFSPDSQHLASGGEDQTVKLWSLNHGRPVVTLQGHTAPLSALCFSADGPTLISGSQDKTVKLWQAIPQSAP